MKTIKKQLQENFAKISEGIYHLFEVNLDKDQMWELYLDSFPEGTNEIYRERREYDCSACRQFVKSIGNAVVIIDNKVKTIWDFETDDSTLKPVLKALDKFVKSHAVSDVYFSEFKKIGINSNIEQLEDGTINEYHHLHLELPSEFINQSSRSLGDIKGEYRDARNVFKRSLDEITEDSLLTVLELIAQNSLYKGEEWKTTLTKFLELKKEYDKMSEGEKENYTWEQSVKIGGAMGRIRNHSIGTLLVNISEGMDLDTAVKKYEDIVAPHNYKRSKPIYSKRMLEDAKKTIQELGYMSALNRRFATIDDITVNNVLFSNKDSAKKMAGFDIFDEMEKSVSINPNRFSKIEEVPIDKFVNDVLPMAQEMEVLLENKHLKNLVSLIAPEDKDSKNMFKWGNSFGWAYKGNITDSSMKERVKSAGGKVDGVLRFSIQWNDEKDNRDDLDAHCIEPNGNEIFFSSRRSYWTGGSLDVDIRHPEVGIPAVENITWESKDRMENGDYEFFVENYANRGGEGGFKAEIEFDGEIFEYHYPHSIRTGARIKIATVNFDKNLGFEIDHKLQSDRQSVEVWGLTTNKFIPVSIAMFSPNYWDEQEGIGNKHYFFMLKDCINDESPNSFYNEFLKEDLMKHRKVFEALGSKTRVANSEDQLSGVGFSSTKRNDLVVKVKGNTERIVRIKF